MLYLIVEAVAQGYHHYLVTQVNRQLPLELSRPLEKQTGESWCGIPSLPSTYPHRNFSWYEVAA